MEAPGTSRRESEEEVTTGRTSQDTLTNIETIITSIVWSLTRKEYPVLQRIKRRSKVDFRLQKSRPTFSKLVRLMEKSYTLIKQGQTATKRDIYYEDVSLYTNQKQFDRLISDLCDIIQVDRKLLNIQATAKGIIAGNIHWKGLNDERIECVSTRSMVIPSNLDGHHEFVSDAKFILVVEKDAIFQKLLEEKIFATLGPFLLVTGKGYPDFGTRRLLNLLVQDLGLPTFILVDGDPYGIEIATIYKWGTRQNSEPCYLVPGLIWLGILPSELSTLSINQEALTDLTVADLRKLQSVQAQLSVQHDPNWTREVEFLKVRNKKAELEVLTTCSPRFLTEVYLKSKIQFHLDSTTLTQ